MAISNRERIQKGLELLKDGLRPFVERELRAKYADKWAAIVNEALNTPLAGDAKAGLEWDNHALLRTVWELWNAVFKDVLSQSHRSMVSELRTVRNEWAHDGAFSYDATYRALNTMRLLLEAVSAPEQARAVGQLEEEVMRVKFAEQRRVVERQGTLIEGAPQAGLRPWREIITPHKDVASGRYQQAEFAADLDQVHRNEGSEEYRDPREFFRRTFVTQGMQHLLVSALRRLSGKGGDPVVQLQTNFGGGKTHSMLALYHLFSGVTTGDLAGLEAVLRTAEVPNAPAARRAVLVGTALAPGQARTKPDGTVIRTLWGEMAWQLGGAKGYAVVAESDRRGTNPGKELLVQLFRAHSPCLVLIDEWVAFTRNLYHDATLPAGSFDNNLSFAQSMTEAARACDRVLLVASLPASQIEIGGEGGQAALARLEQTFSRMESNWRPATAEEGFEIVRRRLFEPIPVGGQGARDAVVKAFGEMYRTNAQEFPQDAAEGAYARRIESAYPIHPELFDRLYTEWSSLDRFQRTRGVLRLMASVIFSLWERGDSSLMILPSSVPLDDEAVRNELTRYFEETWDGAIAKDIDGDGSLPLALDRQYPNLGRYSAARRVARAIFMGAAPTYNSPQPGLDARSVKLGCAQPGEAVATFGDALRRLSNDATYLYSDKERYWFNTQASVARIARDRADRMDVHEVNVEIVRWLRKDKRRGQFAGVHTAPESTQEVPDEMETRLVVLGPEQSHDKGLATSPARAACEQYLTARGNSPRLYRNAVVFLAPDAKKLKDLEEAVRAHMAWTSVLHDTDALNLTAFAKRQAESKTQEAEKAIEARIPEAWIWCLTPEQSDPAAAITWGETRLQGLGGLAERASKKLEADEKLLTVLGPARLRHELDKYVWKDKPHVGLKQLWGYLASYVYLPRLKEQQVLLQCVWAGIQGMFCEDLAYAEKWDETAGKYLGLKTTGGGTVTMSSDSVVVKADVANEQVRRRAAEAAAAGTTSPSGGASVGTTTTGGSPPPPPPPPKPGPSQPTLPRRFHGTVLLDPARVGRDAGRIAEEVIQHLETLKGSRVRVTLEITAEIPNGAPDNVQRTVTENAVTLKFTSHGFETA
jgi:predicted AAA+ superfamily ATPase